jgi:heme A synthase
MSATSSVAPVSSDLAVPRGAAADVGSSPRPERPVPKALARFTALLTVAVLLLIKAGAWVTSTGSGLAYADWPLANGSLWPPGMKLDGLFEHGHRAIGAVIGLLMITAVVLVHRMDRRRGTRILTYVLLGATIVQGVIGGVGVLWKLPALTSVAHGVLAQIILCSTAALAFACSRGWSVVRIAPASTVRTARRLTVVTLCLILAQLLMGAIVRHAEVQSLLWLHVGMAMVVSIAIMLATSFAAGKLGKMVPGFHVTGRWIIGLLLGQLVLGFFTLAVRSPKDPSNIEYLGRSAIVSGHVVIGAALFLATTVLCVRTFRNVQPGPLAGGAA